MPFLSIVIIFFISCGFQNIKDLGATRLIEDPDDEVGFFRNHESEKLRYGLAHHLYFYKHKTLKNTVVEQRSGRKRLFDHNIILRRLFLGEIQHMQFGPLDEIFRNSVFLDFGSAILYDEGAPTVRDIQEDWRVEPYLKRIVATDINDYEYPHTQYYNIFLKERFPYPFEVREIQKSLTDREFLRGLIGEFTSSQYAPIIFRSTNSGPDLFYTLEEAREHFRSILVSNPKRYILYFFNRFVLFRAPCSDSFQLVGLIDESIGVNHSIPAWRYVNWEKRELKTAFRHDKNYLTIRPKSDLTRSEHWKYIRERISCRLNQF